MGITQMCFCCHKYRQTIIWLILFASTLTNIVFMAEGRAISNLIEVTKKDMKDGESIMVAKAQIGSRPPKCEKRCRNCGHCEAVQVPVVPQIQSHRRHFPTARGTVVVTYSRGDDLSNYKPMSWKCKCGDYYFNP
ncbi:EPIDERMAL PATTERNING FACTOR-like protein 2 [Abrus precatorius]|uniref:Epidermal patterning factor-like protein n=1 Tax=Abrus precatorius TaxID=3816 RepID=A0A8B8LL78_ABRPR|nr:EPIDERMAL PATTERNING FACTOR-like protein 2 [Abrus precatorius]